MEVRLFDNEGTPLGELSKEAGTLRSCTMSLEVNGDHSLSLTTTRPISVGTRALTRDERGKWMEWVVDEVDEQHKEGSCAVGSYHLVWSVQYDLQGVNEGYARQVGFDSEDGATARVAMQNALKGQSRWALGTVDVDRKSILLMNYDSAWERLDKVVKYWGGEIDVTVGVSGNGVTSRKVHLLEHIGSTVAKRRLEWHHDMTSVTRKPDPGPYYCRVLPTGNGESQIADDEKTTFSWPLDLEEFYGFKVLQDEEMANLFRVRNPDGTYEYPTVSVSYSTDDPEILYDLAKQDLKYHTRPKIAYTATVSQFAEIGMDTDGIALGDEVQVVDYGFNPDVPLRVQERVLSIEVDLMGVDDESLSIGKKVQKLENVVSQFVTVISPITYTSPEWDYPGYEVPEFPTYTFDDPDLGSITLPTNVFDSSAIDDMLEQLRNRIDDLDTVVGSSLDYNEDTGQYTLGDGTLGGGTAYTGGSSSGGSSSGGGSCNWTHQINGVTQSAGVVNFVTNGSSGGSSSDDSSSSSPSSTTGGFSGGTGKTNKLGDVQSAANRIGVTAANIAGTKWVDPNNVWGTTTTHDAKGAEIKVDERGVMFASL